MAVMLGVGLMPAVAAAQQLVILVRHAERADGGPGAAATTSTPADPPLSAAGEARAARLAAMLADAGITAIYATEFRRTQQTARPLATKLGLPIETMPARDSAALAERLRTRHARDIVLIVGHSNTVPDAIRALGGPAVSMADDEYSAIYLLSPSTGVWTLIRY